MLGEFIRLIRLRHSENLSRTEVRIIERAACKPTGSVGEKKSGGRTGSCLAVRSEVARNLNAAQFVTRLFVVPFVALLFLPL